jgi:pimeloyl-ACP methyl ester carboxylesterase
MASKLLFPVPDRGLTERLYRIRAKTVIIWGEQDRMIPLAHGEAFRDAVADAELIRIPEAGHMVTIERPEALAEALKKLG